MSPGAAFLLVSQRLSYTASSIACLQHMQCTPSALRRISPASPLQCTLYLSRRHASSSKPQKRAIPSPKSPKPTKPASKTAPAKQQPQASKPNTVKSNTARSPSQQPKPHPPSTPFPESPSERLNLPSTSYPPPLEIPARKHGQSWFSYLFTQGKAYLEFYKTGTQNVRATAKQAKRLRNIQKAAAASKSQSDASSASNKDGAVAAGIEGIVLTRAEWQLVRRSRADLIKLPFFGIFLIAFGEWTPLLILFLTPIVPQPCRIPVQVGKELEKLEKRRSERIQALALKAPVLINADRRPGTAQTKASPLSLELTAASVADKVEQVKNMSKWELLNVGARLDAYSGVWEYFMTPPVWWLRFAVRRKLEYLVTDDALIIRDGGYKQLGHEELRRACIERGIFVQDKGDRTLRDELAAWFQKAPTKIPRPPVSREQVGTKA